MLLGPRGPRGTTPMPSSRPGALHLCLGFPTRMGAASTLGGLAWVRGADAALGVAVPAPSPGSLRGSLNPHPTPLLPHPHFHCAPAAHPQVPAWRPQPWRGRHWRGRRRPKGQSALPGLHCPPPSQAGVTVPSARAAWTARSRSLTRGSTGRWTPSEATARAGRCAG